MKIILILSFLTLVGCGKEVSKTEIPYPGVQVPRHNQINKDLPANGNVSDRFVITADGSKIVYISDENTDGINELMVADINGANRKKISAPLDMGENVIRFLVDPTSQKVAYIADPSTGFKNLYTVDLNGTNNYQVNNGLTSTNHSIGHFLWMPSGSKLVYTSDEGMTVGNYALYIANFDGSNRLTLNGGPVGQIFDIAPNGSRIVYRFSLTNPTLRSITPTGTNDVLLNTPFNLGAQPASGISNFVISPNSSLVAYRSNQDDNIKYELFVTNIDGSGLKTKISGALVSGGNVALVPKVDYNFTSDSSSVIYIADQDTNNKNELFISSVSGVNQKLSGNSMIADGDVQSFKTLGNKTLFLADMDINGVNELYGIDHTNIGAGSLKINSPLIAGENVGYYSTDSSLKISYLMDDGSAGVYSVYLNDFTGTNEKELITISGGLGAFDPSLAFAEQLVMKDSKVFFRAAVNNNIYNLYYFNINSDSVHKINEDGGSVLLSGDSLGSSFLITPNNIRAVYRKAMPDGNNLFSSILD